MSTLHWPKRTQHPRKKLFPTTTTQLDFPELRFPQGWEKKVSPFTASLISYLRKCLFLLELGNIVFSISLFIFFIHHVSKSPISNRQLSTQQHNYTTLLPNPFSTNLDHRTWEKFKDCRYINPMFSNACQWEYPCIVILHKRFH